MLGLFCDLLLMNASCLHCVPRGLEVVQKRLPSLWKRRSCHVCARAAEAGLASKTGVFIQGIFAECPCAGHLPGCCPRGRRSGVTATCRALWAPPWEPALRASPSHPQAGLASRRWGPGGLCRPGCPQLSCLCPGLHQDLEQKLSSQEQDAVIVQSMKSELVRLPKVERELTQLREENARLR